MPAYLWLYIPILGFLVWQVWSVWPRASDDEERGDEDC